MKRVLVVDDEADMLWMLQRNLNKGMSDVEILAAESGEEALSILSDKPVNLVISDINMPGMNGLDLLVEITNRYPQTGVIIMTAYPSNTYENQAMLSGSLRFIEKPFDINDMRKIVQETLSSEEGFQGTVDGVDLMDIVQFNGLARATAALKISTANHEGMIFFKKRQCGPRHVRRRKRRKRLLQDALVPGWIAAEHPRCRAACHEHQKEP